MPVLGGSKPLGVKTQFEDKELAGSDPRKDLI